MFYITIDDLLDFAPKEELVELIGDGTDIDPDKASKYIASAQSVVDGYVGRRYAVPLAGDIPGIIKRATANIALWDIYARWRHTDEARRQAYEDAMSLLRDIASGKVNLYPENGAEPAGSGRQTISVNGNKKVFGRDNLIGF